MHAALVSQVVNKVKFSTKYELWKVGAPQNVIFESPVLRQKGLKVKFEGGKEKIRTKYEI